MDRGASQACRTCRRGRINCDFAKPVCTPCRTSGRACTGLGRTLVFKAVDPAARTKAPTPVTASAPAARLYSTAEQQRYIGLFWDAYLPDGKGFPDACRQYTTCGWTDIARRYTCTDVPSVACLAIVANSLCMLGSKHREQHLLEQGRQVYGRALRDMRTSLTLTTSAATATSMSTKVELVIASRLLTLFTILWGTHSRDQSQGEDQGQSRSQGEAWAALNAGELALLLSNAPATYQAGDNHQLFVDTRMHLLIQSIIARDKSVLSEPTWMTEPWAVIPKTPLDRLVDLVAQIPALVARFEGGVTKSSAGEQRSRAWAELKHDWRGFLSGLMAWFNDVAHLGVDGFLNNESSPSLDTLELSKTHAMLVYWTVCLIVRPVLQQVLAMDEIPAFIVNVPSIRYSMLKAMRSLFGSRAGWYGVNVALFPLRTLVYTVDDENPLSASEAVLLANIQNQVKGREVSGFMTSMGKLLAAGASGSRVQGPGVQGSTT